MTPVATADEQTHASATASRIEAIGLSRIVESADNPRKHFPQAWLDELGASMVASGQLTPALVRPHPTKKDHYELAAGASRFRAAQRAGLHTLLCVVRPMDDAKFLEVLTFENLKRRDLQPMEEARGYATLQKKLEGWTVERIAEKSGVSADYVRDRLRLLQLCPEAENLLEQGTIELGHALELAKITASQQKAAIKDGLFETEGYAPDELGLFGKGSQRREKPRTVRELRAWIDRHVRVDLAHPELEHLLPDTARRLAAAKAEQRKQVFISFGYVDPHVKGDQKVIGPQSWKKAENAQGKPTCDHAVLGVVFAGDAARGHAFLVCTNKDRCATHWREHVKKREERAKAARGELTDKQGAKVSEAAVVQKQREQAAKEEAAREAKRKAFEAAQPALVAAMAKGVQRLSVKALGEALLHRFKWIVKHGSPATKKAAALVPEGKTADEMLRRLFWLNELDEFNGVDDAWILEQDDFKALMKRLGVDLDAILKAAAAPEQKAAPAAGRKAGAKKATGRKAR